MKTLEMLESIIKETPCPICLHLEFQIILNCDLSNDPCEHIADCQNCGHKLVITDNPSTIDSLLPKIKEHVEKLECPKCPDSGLVIEYLCEKDSKECFFLGRCEGEKHYSRIDTNGIRYLLG